MITEPSSVDTEEIDDLFKYYKQGKLEIDVFEDLVKKEFRKVKRSNSFSSGSNDGKAMKKKKKFSSKEHENQTKVPT